MVCAGSHWRRPGLEAHLGNSHLVSRKKGGWGEDGKADLRGKVLGVRPDLHPAIPGKQSGAGSVPGPCLCSLAHSWKSS